MPQTTSEVKTFVLNGWAAGPEVWERCTFRYNRLFDYLEQLDGACERAMAETDAAILVGFSLGGNRALKLLLEFPEKVKGLVLVSTTARMMEERSGGGEVMWKGMSERRRQALKYGTQMMNPGNPSPLFAEANLDAGLDYLRRSDLREPLLERSRAGAFDDLPVAIFQGDRDGIVRPHNAEWLHALFPRSTLTMVPTAEHTLPALIPDEITRSVAF